MADTGELVGTIVGVGLGLAVYDRLTRRPRPYYASRKGKRMYRPRGLFNI